ncbi:MAG: hypothetical protein QNJ45_03310 [Ardenticatenaceae bacterium]|nr:hypothetical protein [Ardenticatenaceae bacterium]
MSFHRMAAWAILYIAFVSTTSGIFHLGGGLLMPNPADAFQPDLTSFNGTGDMCFSFEDGQFPDAFTAETTSAPPAVGEVFVDTDFPINGAYALELNTNCGGYCTAATFTRQAAVISRAFSSTAEVAVSFWGRNHADEPHAEDGLFLSDDGGGSYAKVFDFAQLPNANQQISLNLSELAVDAGKTINNQFTLKFQSYDNSNLPMDGYTFDDICLCTQPNDPIPLTVEESGGDFLLSWPESAGQQVEIWYATNQPAFTPGDDCQNPEAGLSCQLVNGSSTTITDAINHPEFNYTFIGLERNLCGQRTPVELAKRKAVIKYGFGDQFASDLAVSLEAPSAVTYSGMGDLFDPISQTIVYTNHSKIYDAVNPVLTYTVPSYFVLVGNPVQPWTQVGSSSTFTLAVDSLMPGASGSATVEMIVGERLAGSAAPTVSIEDLGSAEADPYPINNRDTAQIALLATPDSDGDHLPDWMENGSLVYGSPLSPGTDPLQADTDGDGLIDGDEVRGTAQGLDLPAMGVHPLQKTILIEYDWLVNYSDNDCYGVSHEPSAAAMQMITTAFAEAPVINVDGSSGIQIIHDYGQGGAFTGGNLIPDADGVIDGGIGGPDFANKKGEHFAAQRHNYFHYVILPHRFFTNSNSSGQAELPGDDMIVALQCFGSDTNVAHTVMHELGHNLGLRHGGDVDTNRKPNYNSVMNYRYQFPGVDNDCTPPGNGVLSFSSGSRISLNENTLNEQDGVCGTGAAVPWDWNGNSQLEAAVAHDVNSDGDLEVLHDYNDWENLNFGFGGPAGAQADAPMFMPTVVLEPELPPEAKK